MPLVSLSVNGFVPARTAILLLAAITLQPDPDNPRKSCDKEDLMRLGADMKRRGVLVPLIVRDVMNMVIDGHRRLAAALMVGIEKLPCILVPESTTKAQIRSIQLVTSLTKADLTAYERYCGFTDLKALTPGMTNKDLAAELSVSEALVSMILSLDKCIQPVKDAAKEGAIGLNDWYALSKLSEEQQAVALAARLNGASNGEMKRVAKPKAPAVRVARAKLQLSSGVCVSIAGEGDGLSMDDIIESLAELLKAARKAHDEGLDSKTFQAVLKDRAKAG